MEEGHRCRSSQDEIEPHAGGRGGARTLVDAAPLDVVHVSDDYVVVAKPADCRIDGDFDVTLEKLLNIHMARAGGATGGVDGPSLQRLLEQSVEELRYVHRLDFATSGLLCVARTKPATTAAMKLFQERKVEKLYVAMVWGYVPRRAAPGGRFKSCDSSLFGVFGDPSAVEAEQQQQQQQQQQQPGGGGAAARHDRKRKRVKGRIVASCFFRNEVEALRQRQAAGKPLDPAEQELLSLTWREVKRRPTQARPFLEAESADAARFDAEQSALAAEQARLVKEAVDAGAAPEGPDAGDAGVYVIDANIADRERNRDFRVYVGSPAAPGRTALTHMIVDRHGSFMGQPVSLVRVRLHSGRRHQIRVHLKHAGFTIVGDATYGDERDDDVTRMYLHAQKLCIPLPVPLQFETPHPFDGLLEEER